MKTAISIPDPVYASAEELAHRLGKSRSELYAKAVQDYVERHHDSEVTAKLDVVYSSEPSGPDPVLTNLQTRSWLQNNPW